MSPSLNDQQPLPLMDGFSSQCTRWHPHLGKTYAMPGGKTPSADGLEQQLEGTTLVLGQQRSPPHVLWSKRVGMTHGRHFTDELE